MHDDPRKYLPHSKSDVEAVQKLIRLGYPAVEPVIPQMLEWLQDINWPVALELAPFLSTIGLPLVPELKKILGTEDGVWKYWCLDQVVREFDEIAFDALLPELKRIVEHPSLNEKQEEVDLIAKELLERRR